MKRRQFLRQGIIAGAGITALGSLTLQLSSCKKEKGESIDISPLVSELQQKERRSDDVFSFFYTKDARRAFRVSRAALDNDGIMKSFSASAYVITTNFNPVDPIFHDLVLNKTSNGPKNKSMILTHPKYPEYTFKINQIKLNGKAQRPKRCDNSYIVNQDFINAIFGKFPLNS